MPVAEDYLNHALHYACLADCSKDPRKRRRYLAEEAYWRKLAVQARQADDRRGADLTLSDPG